MLSTEKFVKAVNGAHRTVCSVNKVDGKALLHLLSGATPAEREAFREKLFLEAESQLSGVDGGSWTAEKIANRCLQVKGNANYILAAIPEGVRGRRIDKDAAAAQREAAIEQYAAMGLRPVFDDNGKVTGLEAIE